MSQHDRDRHADTIIRNHALFSTASGAIPVAFADIAAVSAVQLDMIRQLCDVYGADFQVKRGKALVTAITSAALARAGAASLVKLVPIAGTLVGGVTGALLAGASSYALGQAFKTHLSAGGTFLDIDTDRLRRVYREQFDKGKRVVQEWRKDSTAVDDESEAHQPGGRFDFAAARKSSPTVETVAQPAETPQSSRTQDVNFAQDDHVPPAARGDTQVDLPANDSGESAPDAGRRAEDWRSAGRRLQALKNLRTEKLISEEEYAIARQRLLAEL